MSLKSSLLHALGVVAGILIPGASASTTDLTHRVQQELADLYGAAAAKMAEELKLDTTGLSGPEKVFAINKALVATALRDGFKGDAKILGHVTLDIAQAAYRKTEPNIDSDIVALATSLTANPLVLVAAELVGNVVQKLADEHVPAAKAA